jgi:VWFA-related protein
VILAGLLLLAARPGAQAPHMAETAPAPRAAATSASEPAVFRSGVDIVALNVVATDGQQRFVSGLDSGDFIVLEDGVPQDVSFFATGEVPLDLAMLLDTSASMTDKMEIMQRAALGFAETLRPADRALLIELKDSTRVLHPLDGDLDQMPAAIKRTTASGGTGLYNGLYLAFRELAKARRPGDLRRQAIVVLTDGQDTRSLLSYEDVLDVARQSGIATYAISIRAPRLTQLEELNGSRFLSEQDYLMRKLAQETGGQAFFPMEIGQLAGVYRSIAHELASQYALGYTPKIVRNDGVFRRIVVRVTDRPDVRVRTRSGYIPERRAGGAALE